MLLSKVLQACQFSTEERALVPQKGGNGKCLKSCYPRVQGTWRRADYRKQLEVETPDRAGEMGGDKSDKSAPLTGEEGRCRHPSHSGNPW